MFIRFIRVFRFIRVIPNVYSGFSVYSGYFQCLFGLFVFFGLFGSFSMFIRVFRFIRVIPNVYSVYSGSSTSGNQGSKVAEISSETVLVLRQVMNWKGNMTVKCLDSPPDYNNGTGNLNIKFGIFNGR